MNPGDNANEVAAWSRSPVKDQGRAEAIKALKEQMRQYIKPSLANLSQLDLSKGKVTFAKANDHTYGFDDYDPANGGLRPDYVDLGIGSEIYNVPFLSVLAGAATRVVANFVPKTPTDPLFKAESISFLNRKRNSTKSTPPRCSNGRW